MPSKRRNIRSTLRISSNPIIDVAKYVAEVQELSKNVMKELNNIRVDTDLFKEENSLIPDPKAKTRVNYTSNNNVAPKQTTKKDYQNISDLKIKSTLVNSEDSSFDNVIQSFINEEDDWLSQALSSEEPPKTIQKSNFVKSKSSNELSLTQPIRVDLGLNHLSSCKNKGSKFRRTSSFDITTATTDSSNTIINNFSEFSDNICGAKEGKNPVVQYSQQEIEKKRLEAIYRRERKEIERKKMEALRRLEMNKMKIVKHNYM